MSSYGFGLLAILSQQVLNISMKRVYNGFQTQEVLGFQQRKQEYLLLFGPRDYRFKNSGRKARSDP